MIGIPARAQTGLALFFCLIGQSACARQAASTAASPSSAPTPAPRILLVGLDGADWEAINGLVQSGKLPTFARLKRSGRTGILLATPPLLSPILWTTIATGRHPEDHGVLDFMEDLPGGGQTPVTASSRQVPALWNLFSDAGRRVGVVGWWATWPAEDLRGTVVSDRVAPQLVRGSAGLDPQAVSPRTTPVRLSGVVVRADQITLQELSRYLPLTPAEHERAMAAARLPTSHFYDDRFAHLAAVVAATRTYTAMAEEILRSESPELLAVYLEGVDTVSHLFIRDRKRGPSAIEAAYRDADALIGRVAALSAPDAWVVVCSDHGFQPPSASAAIREDPANLTGPAAAWHRPYGIVAAAPAGALSGRSEGSAPIDLGLITPLDIAPTILHAAGLTVSSDMTGRVIEGLLPEGAVTRPVRRGPLAFRPARAAEASASHPAPDEAALARLRALGYVGAQPTSLARQNLGEILYRRGRFDAAEGHLRAVVEAQPRNLSAHLWLGKALRAQRRDRAALEVYRQALDLPGGLREALVEAVDLAASAGRPGEASQMVAAIKPTPADASRVHTARAIAAAAEGRAATAEAELKAALASDPLDVEPLSRLLDLLLPARRAREALPFARRAALAAAGSARHQALLGESLLGAGQAVGAEEALARALELAPDSAPLRLDLARAQLTQGKAREARATLEPVPPSLERSLLLGASASAQGEWSEAAAHYESALQSGPPTPELLNGLGWVSHKQGRNDQAAELFRRSLALDGRQPAIRRLLDQIDGARAQ